MNAITNSRWQKAITIGVIIFALLSLYLFLRRGYYNLSIINKSLASTAAVIAALTLLIGPLSRIWTIFGKFLDIRRQLGLFTFVSGTGHAIISAFFIPNRFNLTWFIHEWPATLSGVAAIVIWLYLTSLSHNSSIKKLGGNAWIKRQQWGGHIALYAVFFHLILLKYASWIEWFQGKTKQTQFLKNPEYPPASLFVFLFMTCIIIYRLLLVLKKKNK